MTNTNNKYKNLKLLVKINNLFITFPMLEKNFKNERVESMEEDLANLKGEIGEIKSLLKELVNGK